MGKKRTYRQRVRSSKEVKRDRAIRDRFQAQRPTLDQLIASGDYTHPLQHRQLLSLMEFAAAIKANRIALGISLSQLAKTSGIDKAAISKLEGGRIKNPTFNTLERIASALGKHVRLTLHDAKKSGRAVVTPKLSRQR